MKSGENLDNVPDSSGRYTLGECLGAGVFGRVLEAIDSQENNKQVAIKLQKLNNETKVVVEEEYKTLRDFNKHPNLIDFYGIFRRDDEIWFVLELCEGGPVSDLVNGLLKRNRRMVEEHIAYVLKEVVRALIYLHTNNVVHRDVKCSNILLTKEGEVKLGDFGLATKVPERGCLKERFGSAAWMAPEVAKTGSKYDLRADVWSIGMTAIELGDGKNPFQEMNPSRALFQIVNNPPPTLYRPSNWTLNYNDFISECLEQNYENRPCMMEIVDHPFLDEIPDNNFYLSLELKSLINELENTEKVDRCPEIIVKNQFLKKDVNGPMEKMLLEDLAALDKIDEESVIQELQDRFENGEFQTFIGDVLLVLNPNEKKSIYNEKFHQKYLFKSRSDNAPHIYSIADTTYQHALHHCVPQTIILSGESGAGKTMNYLHLVNHLLFLGHNSNINPIRIKNAIKLIHSLTHASTPLNDYSTRCLLKTNIFFGQTGKISAAEFNVYLLEKWRISSVDMCQGNFHVLYYFYDGLNDSKELEKYKLKCERSYRYLRVNENKISQARNDINKNVAKYRKIVEYLKEFEFEESQIESVYTVIAAILNLGDVKFKDNENFDASMEDGACIENVAQLLCVDRKKLIWALTNYCLIKNGIAIRKSKSADEARSSRDVLANTLYMRLTDYIVNVLNEKLAIGKSIFGKKYSVKIYDYFGFECFQTNHLSQLFINCLNEQLQYHYLQRFFAWETLDVQGEDVDYKPISVYNNKNALDGLLGKPEGVLTYVDEASKKGLGGKLVLDYIQNQDNSNLRIVSNHEFSIAHYTGKVTYSTKEMPDKNRDYLPPEVIETLRLSENPIIQLFFCNKLEKTGNLHCQSDEEKLKRFSFLNPKKISDEHRYSQTRKIRTSAAVFRAVSLDLLRDLSTGSGSGGTHYIRCIQTNLKSSPNMFHKGLVRQQLRALAVIPTAKSRQEGYTCRISFPEFLRRYQLLAFDFNEPVDMTRDNCRLLLIRLKMEGWMIGKSKVFLKYYNEEYLARLYEIHVKKIVKIQSILRGFLVKCKISKKAKEEKQEEEQGINNRNRRRSSVMSEEEAAEIIQKAYRKSALKKIHELSLNEYELLSEEQYAFIKPFAKKWKNKSMFNVLLQYRARKIQDSFNFAQQVHLYNLNAFHELQKLDEQVDVDGVNREANILSWLGKTRPTVTKVAFRLEDIPIYDTANMMPININEFTEKEESWDTPYRWKDSKSTDIEKTTEKSNDLAAIPYQRNSEEAIKELPSPSPEPHSIKQIKHKENEHRQHLFQKPITPKKIQTVKNVNKEPEEQFIINSTPANKDFDYIKGAPEKPKFPADPIIELKKFVRRSSLVSEDEPPFNFKGMLRKTNFDKEPIKKTPEIKVNYALPKKTKIENIRNTENRICNEKVVTVELGNGLVLTGTEVDL